MRPTEPGPTIPNRASAVLLEDLGLALRDVGVHDWDLTSSERGLDALRRVKEIDEELARRGVPVLDRLARLADETGWEVPELLDQCRQYPSVRPRLRERDGVRRAFRCRACRSAEHPETDTVFTLCDGCLMTLKSALLDPRDLPNALLFRSFSVLARCEHANSDTVLGVYPWFGGESEIERGHCLRCVEDEFARRRAG